VVSLRAGQNTIEARAVDVGQNIATAKVEVNYPDDPPTISITSPRDRSSTSSSTITVKGTTKDDKGISHVYFRVNNGEWRQASKTCCARNRWGRCTSYCWDAWTASARLNFGWNTLEAKAVDVGSNVATASIKVFRTS
jgi:hypothetical protein